jgi:hypothetical protein
LTCCEPLLITLRWRCPETNHLSQNKSSQKKFKFSIECYDVTKQPPCSRDRTGGSSTVTSLIVSLPRMSVQPSEPAYLAHAAM